MSARFARIAAIDSRSRQFAKLEGDLPTDGPLVINVRKGR